MFLALLQPCTCVAEEQCCNTEKQFVLQMGFLTDSCLDTGFMIATHGRNHTSQEAELEDASPPPAG